MKTEKKIKKSHKGLHKVLAVVSVIFLIISIVITFVAESFSGTLDGFASGISVNISKEELEKTVAEAEILAEKVEAEGAVLLRNEENTLPLSKDTKTVNVFGWASVDWLGGGSGSGGVTSVDVDLLDALKQYGIKTNTELSQMYEEFQGEREYKTTLHSFPEQSYRLYEPSISDKKYYSEKLLENAKQFSDTAIVVLGRNSGESNDLTQQQYKRIEKDGEIQIDKARTYLDLSVEEEALLTYAGENYKNVIVIINSANVMALGPIEKISGIDACLMAGFTGQKAATALPKILWGEYNPSGRTADTWAYDFSTAATYANAAAGGVGKYTGAEGLYPANGTNNGNLGVEHLYEQVSFLDYAEGIYIGYKWYETADAESFWADVDNAYGKEYEGVVQYPFGYGLSYTTFTQEIISSSIKDGGTLSKDDEIILTIRVTNTGTVDGKEVVQIYCTAPYTKGEIEKSYVELCGFAKTDVIKAGKYEDVKITVKVKDLASYDCYDANKNGFAGYELDAGSYQLKLMKNAHQLVSENSYVTYMVKDTIQYPVSASTGKDVNNKFTGSAAWDKISLDGSDTKQNITYLTRADFKGTFPKNNVESRPMTDNLTALNLYTKEDADAWIDASDQEITTGANNGLLVMKDGVLTELGYQLGKNYDDPMWEKLMDQLTINEMMQLVTHGYGHLSGVASVGKPITLDADGPAQIGGFTGVNPGTGFPSSSTLAQTFNTQLALEVGRMIGHQAAQRGYSGWYAPAVNMHRSPFNGRNYEYYSEDSFLSGQLCGNTVAGCLDAGTYCYVKHFICNDGEAGIYRDSIYIWMTEQTLREIYLKPFQIIVEEYGATGLMSSYNRIGAVWTGGSKALLTGILREEWGFKGAVITDYSDHHEFMNGDQMLRAGGDIWMDGVMPGSLKFETESNSFKQALRRASKNILYMVLNAQVENTDYIEATKDESLVRPEYRIGIPLWRVGILVLDFIAVLFVMISVRLVIKDQKKKNIQNTTFSG